MDGTNNAPQINWSVWGNNSTVSWNYQGNDFSAILKMPPLSVADIPLHSLIAIVGNYEEFGSTNLLLYSYDGGLVKTLTAPDLGAGAHFGRVYENHGKVSAAIGFIDKTGWVEKEGSLDMEEGTIAQLHRSY